MRRYQTSILLKCSLNFKEQSFKNNFKAEFTPQHLETRILYLAPIAYN